MSEKKVTIQIAMFPDERESIHELARKQGYTITADYIRDLILKNADENGFAIEFQVDRGGDRIPRD